MTLLERALVSREIHNGEKAPSGGWPWVTSVWTPKLCKMLRTAGLICGRRYVYYTLGVKNNYCTNKERPIRGLISGLLWYIFSWITIMVQNFVDLLTASFAESKGRVKDCEARSDVWSPYSIGNGREELDTFSLSTCYRQNACFTRSLFVDEGRVMLEEPRTCDQWTREDTGWLQRAPGSTGPSCFYWGSRKHVSSQFQTVINLRNSKWLWNWKKKKTTQNVKV